MSPNQFKNLLAFLVVMTNEDATLLSKLSPDYIVEKFARYAGVGTLRDDDGWQWGLHPTLRRYFDDYVEAWKVDTALEVGA